MRLLSMKFREWYLAGRVCAAADVMAYREADYKEAKSVYFRRILELRKLRREIAMRDSAPTLIREIVSR